MSITKILFPPANRQAALVAFFRTAWQTIRGVGVLGIIGGVTINAQQLAHIDWVTTGYAAGAIVLSGVLSGGIAFVNILGNGLPATYTATAVASVPSAVVVPAAPAPIVATVETVPVAVPDVSSPTL